MCTQSIWPVGKHANHCWFRRLHVWILSAYQQRRLLSDWLISTVISLVNLVKVIPSAGNKRLLVCLCKKDPVKNVSFPENNDWYFSFVAGGSSSKRKSWRVIDGSIKLSESKRTVFGATEPARHGRKFHLPRTDRHFYQSFQHRNELLLNKGLIFTVFSTICSEVSKTCEFWNRKTLLLEIAIGLPVAPNYGMSFLSWKKTKWGRLTQKGLRVPLLLQWSPFLREGTGHFRSSGEQIR